MLSIFSKCKSMIKEICNEYEKSVKISSGLFVNRVPDFNDKKTRIEMGKPFPEGDFICIECDNKFSEAQ